MRRPLRVVYDEPGDPISIEDADGRLIVEDMGPEGTFADADALVRAFNEAGSRLPDIEMIARSAQVESRV